MLHSLIVKLFFVTGDISASSFSGWCEWFSMLDILLAREVSRYHQHCYVRALKKTFYRVYNLTAFLFHHQ
jgi:hypothetical protein